MTHIRQFKLTNDDEIICEVLEYSTQDNAAMVIRGALRLVCVEDFSRNIRFYAFRPWMGFNDNTELLQTLNSDHIICDASPSDEMLSYYASTLQKLKENSEKKTKADMPLDDIAKHAEDMDEDEFEAFLEEYILTNSPDKIQLDSNRDSDQGENIIQFKPKGTVH